MSRGEAAVHSPTHYSGLCEFPQFAGGEVGRGVCVSRADVERSVCSRC